MSQRIQPDNNDLPVESASSKRIALTDMSEKIGHRDALYLFSCHLEWLTKRNLAAYQELLAGARRSDGDIRGLAEYLLHEARQGWSELRQVSNPGEVAAVPSRKTSGKLFAICWTGAQRQHRR